LCLDSDAVVDVGGRYHLAISNRWSGSLCTVGAEQPGEIIADGVIQCPGGIGGAFCGPQISLNGQMKRAVKKRRANVVQIDIDGDGLVSLPRNTSN
jgi:predicted lipoprotein